MCFGLRAPSTIPHDVLCIDKLQTKEGSGKQISIEDGWIWVKPPPPLSIKKYSFAFLNELEYSNNLKH